MCTLYIIKYTCKTIWYVLHLCHINKRYEVGRRYNAVFYNMREVLLMVKQCKCNDCVYTCMIINEKPLCKSKLQTNLLDLYIFLDNKAMFIKICWNIHYNSVFEVTKMITGRSTYICIYMFISCSNLHMTANIYNVMYI